MHSQAWWRWPALVSCHTYFSAASQGPSGTWCCTVESVLHKSTAIIQTHEVGFFDIQNLNCKRFLVESNSSSFIRTASIFCSKKETREKHLMHVYLHGMRQVEGYWLTLCFVNVFSQLFAQRICQEKKHPAFKNIPSGASVYKGAKLLFLNTGKK